MADEGHAERCPFNLLRRRARLAENPVPDKVRIFEYRFQNAEYEINLMPIQASDIALRRVTIVWITLTAHITQLYAVTAQIRSTVLYIYHTPCGRQAISPSPISTCPDAQSSDFRHDH